MPSAIVDIMVNILQLLFFLLACYYLGVAVFSLFPSRSRAAQEMQYLRFAVIIPAHNEAAVLSSLLASLMNQDYPQAYLRTFVVADHCTDDTVMTAQSFGAEILRRPHANGKGYAVTAAIRKILNAPEPFDAVVLLDADNVADSRFLAEINDCMLQGHAAGQGYVDVKNPNASWVAHAHAMWYWITNRVSQMGFDRLGMGCRLNGTGFALTCQLLRQVPWDTVSMAEDAEYTLKLAMADVKVAYAPRAVVYDEKPDSFAVSVLQRCRWAQGITEVQRDYAGQLLRRRKWTTLLRFWSDMFTPLCFAVFLILDLFAILNLCQITAVKFVDFWMHPVDFVLLNVYLVGMILTVCCGLALDKKYSSRVVLNFFGFVTYLLSWIPIGLYGVLRHTKKEWYHTAHKHSY